MWSWNEKSFVSEWFVSDGAAPGFYTPLLARDALPFRLSASEQKEVNYWGLPSGLRNQDMDTSIRSHVSVWLGRRQFGFYPSSAWPYLISLTKWQFVSQLSYIMPGHNRVNYIPEIGLWAKASWEWTFIRASTLLLQEVSGAPWLYDVLEDLKIFRFIL